MKIWIWWYPHFRKPPCDELGLGTSKDFHPPRSEAGTVLGDWSEPTCRQDQL